jgi:NitT/TauT family transport system substrate-binding protein
MRRFLSLLIVLYSLSFVSCSDSKKEIKISVSNWIGYVPLLYIKERDILKNRVTFIHSLSVSESLTLFNLGITDSFTGTQYQFLSTNRGGEDIVMPILLDRSFGGDAVVSNRSVEGLKRGGEFELYFEANSVSSSLFQYFIEKYKLEDISITLHNITSSEIEKIKLSEKPTVVVSQYPHLLKLIESGFQTVISTEEDDILVVDGIFTTEEIFEKNRELFVELKGEIKKAIRELERNPKEVYLMVRKYLNIKSYEDFISSLEKIQWIKERDEKLEEMLDRQRVSTEWLIR